MGDTSGQTFDPAASAANPPRLPQTRESSAVRPNALTDAASNFAHQLRLDARAEVAELRHEFALELKRTHERIASMEQNNRILTVEVAALKSHLVAVGDLAPQTPAKEPSRPPQTSSFMARLAEGSYTVNFETRTIRDEQNPTARKPIVGPRDKRVWAFVDGLNKTGVVTVASFMHAMYGTQVRSDETAEDRSDALKQAASIFSKALNRVAALVIAERSDNRLQYRLVASDELAGNAALLKRTRRKGHRR